FIMIKTVACIPLLFSTLPPPLAIYTLSLHDALPISVVPGPGHSVRGPVLFPPADSHHPTVSLLRSRATLSVYLSRPERQYRHDRDRKSTRLNSSHVKISYAVFCLKKKKKTKQSTSTT